MLVVVVGVCILKSLKKFITLLKCIHTHAEVAEVKNACSLQFLLHKENWHRLFELAEKNRLLVPFCRRVISLRNIPEEVNKKASGLLSNEARVLNNLAKTIQTISKAFKRENVMFVIMKTFQQYPRPASDIDLILDKENLHKAVMVLKKLNYNIYRGIVQYEPYKIKCVSKRSFIDIDIYPRVAWRGLTYIGENYVLRRRKFMHYLGAGVYLPSDEDDLLIVCTHTFSHCRITLGDIFHLILLLQKRRTPLDWNYILETADMNRTIPVLFRFLHLVNLFSVYSFGRSVITQEVFNNFKKFWVIRIFSNFLIRDFFRNKTYPYTPSPILLLITTIYGAMCDIKAHNFSLAIERIVKSVSHMLRLILVILGIYNHFEF